MTLLGMATWLALIATCAALVVNAVALRSRSLARWASRSVLAAWAASSLPLILLVVDFLAGRLDLFYVWQNIQTGYPWWLRLAGVWGGQAGTFLLWTWFVLGAALLENRWGQRPAWPRARVILLAVAVVLLVPTVVLRLGAATSAFGLTIDGTFVEGASGPGPLALRPDGQGLNPLLESPYMAIHPVVEFLAYGLTAVPFAYGLVHLFRGEAWRKAAMRWARPAWLAFLTAITLGSLWAYTVLSFGGYWIWDPVEVGNLLPFIALTILLHAAPARDRDQLGLVAPATAVVAFTLIVFANFVVRSGLWSSVHAFLPTGLSITIEDPTRRLLVAVQESFQAAYATRMAVLAVATTAAAVTTYHARRLARGSTARKAALAVIAAYGLVAVAGLVAPVTTVSVLHQVAGIIGFGHPIGGVAGLAGLTLLPFVAGLLAMPEDVEISPRLRAGQLVLAAWLLIIALAVTLLLLVLGVNGYGPAVFTSRAPYLAAPILAGAGLAFHRGRFDAWAGALAAGVGVGLVARWVTGSWAWAAVPAALVPAAGALWVFACRARPTTGKRQRIQAVLLAVAGIAGLVHWLWPGAVVVAGVALSSPAWYAPVGVVAGLVAIAAPYLEGRVRVPAWLGPLAAIASIGYGLAVVLGFTALVLGPRRAHGPRGRLPHGLVPLIHVGLALTVLGVAVTTYGATTASFDQADPLVRGEPRAVPGGTVELVGGAVEDTDQDGRIDEVSARIHVYQDGAFVAEETLTLAHNLGTGFTSRGSFVPEESPVTRAWWGDLAHNADTTTPLAIRLSGGNDTWVTANGPPPRSFPDEVDAVSLGVKRLPAVNVLWAGVGLLWAGMATRTVAERTNTRL